MSGVNMVWPEESPAQSSHSFGSRSTGGPPSRGGGRPLWTQPPAGRMPLSAPRNPPPPCAPAPPRFESKFKVPKNPACANLMVAPINSGVQLWREVLWEA